MVRAIEIMIIAIDKSFFKKEVYHNMYLQESVYFLLKSNPYQVWIKFKSSQYQV